MFYKIKKTLILFIIIPLLISCSNYRNNLSRENDIKDIKSFDILMNQYFHNIENLWGINEILITGPKDYVKYTDQYQTRSHINFFTGDITIETIKTVNTNFYLRKAIINTLLMDDNINSFYSINKMENNSIINEPFLYGQVLDDKGQAIRCKTHAVNFADYLLENRLKVRKVGLTKIWFIKIQLVPNHMDKRSHKYFNLVNKASKKYGIDQSLILAIIQIESNFNPYAISPSHALGLMQVVQNSAGRDVFKMKGKWGSPSRKYLLNPENNIDTGTAYLSILKNIYLNGILNPISKKYAIIASYNSGPSSVLKIFAADQFKAIKVINNMKPEEVYQALYTKHPSIEARRYLHKVNNLQKNYKI